MQTDNRLLIPGYCVNAYELPFCKIIVLSPNTVEVIIDGGVEMTGAMVQQLHDFLVTNLHAPIYLLINNVNSYSYDFIAQRELGAIPEIWAMAIVAYNRVTDIAMHSLAALPRDTNWIMQIFSNRDAALAWLSAAQQIKFQEAL